MLLGGKKQGNHVNGKIKKFRWKWKRVFLHFGTLLEHAENGCRTADFWMSLQLGNKNDYDIVLNNTYGPCLLSLKEATKKRHEN